MKSVYNLLVEQGFILFPEGESNLIKAPRAFFAARVVEWMRRKGRDPDFNLKDYLVALTYYKLGMADLKFQEDELLYRHRGVTLGGVEGEFSQDSAEPLSAFHRPGEPAPTPEGPIDDKEP